MGDFVSEGSKISFAGRSGGVIRLIRETLVDAYGRNAAEKVPVLFGGSVNSANVGGYLTIPGVNGVLVGGASLILQEFTDIIEIAKRVRV